MSIQDNNMTLKMLDIFADASDWDAYVTAHPLATVYHLSAWGRAVSRSMGHDYYYLMVEEGGQTKGVLPLIHVKSRLFGNALISVGFATNGGPLFDDSAALKLLDRQAKKLSKDLGVDYLECRNTAAVHENWPTKSEQYSTFRKSLSCDNEENLLAIPRKQRAMVRKGIKFGLKAQIDDTIDRLYPLYAESLRNLGSPVFPKNLFQYLLEEYGDDCEILTVCDDQGRPVSSVMSFYFRNEVIPYYGGGSRDARRLAANDFMYWSVMEHAVNSRKTRIFDFGRSKNGTGAFNFKKNWGFEPVALHYEFILKEGENIPDINPLNPKYQLMIKTWKKLPLVLSNFMGPYISRSLG